MLFLQKVTEKVNEKFAKETKDRYNKTEKYKEISKNDTDTEKRPTKQ